MIYERWWVDPRFRYGDATFHPRGMTADELTAGCYRARTEFNTYGSLFNRLWETRATLRSPRRRGQYMLSTMIPRGEIHATQGRALGGPEPLDWGDGTDAPADRAVAV